MRGFDLGRDEDINRHDSIPSPGRFAATLFLWERVSSLTYAAIFTNSKSPGLLSIDTFGAAIQPAYLPGSLSGTISDSI